MTDLFSSKLTISRKLSFLAVFIGQMEYNCDGDLSASLWAGALYSLTLTDVRVDVEQFTLAISAVFF